MNLLILMMLLLIIGGLEMQYRKFGKL